jgi:hypothetical protein
MLLARPSVGLHISPGPDPSCTYLCSHLPSQLTCSQMKTYGVFYQHDIQRHWEILTYATLGGPWRCWCGWDLFEGGFTAGDGCVYWVVFWRVRKGGGGEGEEGG